MDNNPRYCGSFYVCGDMDSRCSIAIAFYGVFFQDFGEKEHVFSRPRRWAEEKKATFFGLSAEEETIVSELAADEQTKTK
ncbi:hypothetical protein DXG01_008737 [Tephrocybe rancida]|nr:hypothetical protein DXG01_008737 [Tephrocybe rancida]